MTRAKKSFPWPNGFTLIELLVVISIISLLSSVVLANVKSARDKARDQTRVSSLKTFQNAVEAYYNDHGYYPYGEINISNDDPASTGYNNEFGYSRYSDPGFQYGGSRTGNNCNAWSNADAQQNVIYTDTAGLHGLLNILYQQNYINTPNWRDPSGAVDLDTLYNCRYAVYCPTSSASPAGGSNRSSTNQICEPKPQRYVLHCTLESNGQLSANDGGTSAKIYELYSPDNTMCVKAYDWP